MLVSFATVKSLPLGCIIGCDGGFPERDGLSCDAKSSLLVSGCTPEDITGVGFCCNIGMATSGIDTVDKVGGFVGVRVGLRVSDFKSNTSLTIMKKYVLLLFSILASPNLEQSDV